MPTLQKTDPVSHEQWLDLVKAVADQVEDWSHSQNWSVLRYEKRVIEDEGEQYDAPALRVRMPEGEIHLNPIARQIAGNANGRVDLESWPSLNRVRLILRDGGWDHHH